MTAIPFTRLALVEWRKQLDTRAARWLLISIALVVAAVVAVMAAVEGTRSLEALYYGTSTPTGLLLPVVGILAATSEWSQRTGLVTFTLEPRRTRVGLAKLVTALGTGLVLATVAIGLAAAAHLGVVVFTDVPAAWDVPARVLWGGVLVTLLSMAQGVAFGLLVRNTAGAIVAFFTLPVVFGVVASLIGSLRDVLPWIDLTTAGDPVFYGDVMTGEQWAQLGTASALWIVLPLVVGLIRLSRSEITSA